MCEGELTSYTEAKVIEDGSSVCENCFKKNLKREYCPVCRKKWDDSNIEMIECNCEMWVHQNCDPELTKELFHEFSSSGKTYFCPICRRNQKNTQIVEFITLLSEYFLSTSLQLANLLSSYRLDEYHFFEMPVDTTIIPNYKLVIERPMDFSTMTTKARENVYLDLPREEKTYDLLLTDFNLICDNAMIYNMPKSSIYLQAKKLKKLAHYAFNWFQPLLTQQSREFLKGLRKRVLGPLKVEFMREIDEYYYDILFTEPDANSLTKIRLIEGKNKIVNPIKKNESKEILIEITGLNFLLTEKSREDRKSSDQMQTRKQIQAEQDSLATTVKDEILGDSSFSQPTRELDQPKREASEVKKHSVTNHQYKSFNREVYSFIDELLKNNPRNKPFFYFTSIFIQFSNPALLIEDTCYLCGSFGDQDCFLRCGSCSEAYHNYCISKAYVGEDKLKAIQTQDKPWMCPKCKICDRCHKKSEFYDCLICEKCDKLYHLQCLYSNISVVFPAFWQCENCFSCANCGGNKVINETLLSFDAKQNTIYPEFCEDFKYCYECGLKLAYYKFCRICKKYCQKSVKDSDTHRTRKGEELRGLQYINTLEDSIECSKCGYYYHLVCYQEDFGKFKGFDDFVCYYCKQEYLSLEDFHRNTLAKTQEVRNRIKLARGLLKVCEQVIPGKKSDDLERVLPVFVCENYKSLIENPLVRQMLENFKFLDPATKILLQKGTATETQIDGWELVLECWMQQMHSSLSKLELELVQNLELVKAHQKANMPLQSAMTRPEVSGTHNRVASSITLQKVLGEFELDGSSGAEPRLLSVLPSAVLESAKGSEAYSTFEVVDSPCWTYGLIYNTFKQKGEQLVFYTEGLSDDGMDRRPTTWLKEIEIICLQKLSETKFACLQDQLKATCNYRPALVDPRLAEVCLWDLLFKGESLEVMEEPLSSKENFPFYLQNPLRKGKPTVQDFKSQNNYSSYEELAKMLINEMKAIEFLRLRYQHWYSQPSNRARFQQEGQGLKFSGAIYKTPRPTFNHHSHAGGTRSAHSSSNANRLAIAPANYHQSKGLDLHGSGTTSVDKRNDMSIEHETSADVLKREESMNIEESKSPKASTSTSQFPNQRLPSSANPPSDSEDSSSQKFPRDLLDEQMVLDSEPIHNDKKNGPLDNMECICCKQQGDRTLSGRLLFVDFDQWVHANCALWSYDVYEDLEGGLINFLIAHKRGLACMCVTCGKSGSTLICNSKKCQNKFHFQCALESNCSFLANKKFYCRNCSLTKNLSNRLINDFSTKRRLYIKRNQHIFNPESSKNLKYLKERPLDLSNGGYARVGSLSLLALKRLNIDTKLLFNQYYVVRLVEDTEKKTREPLLVMMELQDKGYDISAEFIDKSELTRINFLQRQLSGELDEQVTWTTVDSIERFQDLMRRVLNRRDFRPQFKDFMGDFLGLYSEDLRTWLKSSYVKEGAEPSRPENPSFDKCFYSSDLDQINPFERTEKVGDLYSSFIQKVSKIIKPKDDIERFKNPRDRSFNHKVTAVKAGKRKGDHLASLDFMQEEPHLEHDTLLMTELEAESGKINKIFSSELECKLKQEYLAYRKHSPKVFVAPSPIHKYGLFALQK